MLVLRSKYIFAWSLYRWYDYNWTICSVLSYITESWVCLCFKPTWKEVCLLTMVIVAESISWFRLIFCYSSVAGLYDIASRRGHDGFAALLLGWPRGPAELKLVHDDPPRQVASPPSHLPLLATAAKLRNSWCKSWLCQGIQEGFVWTSPFFI